MRIRDSNNVKPKKESFDSKEKSGQKNNKNEKKDNSDKKKSAKNDKAKNKSSQKNQMSKQKKKSIIIGVVCGAVVLAIIIGIILGVKSCQNGRADSYRYEYANTTVVGYYGKQISTVKRVKPVSEIKNEGLPAYPTYGYTLSSVIGSNHDADRQALINESSYLTATGTWNGGGGNYTWMDKDGYLYRGTTSEPIPTVDTQSKHRQLYQHTSSVGMYFGDVADSEPGVVKEMTFRPRSYTRGYNVTGLYAPAGEVIKIEISEKDMKATNGITFHIGQALYNGKANNIWTAKGQMQRFPVIMNTMSVTPSTATLKDGVYTAYIGSFIGGPIYVRNESVQFKITVSGGVNYSHFILGYTTKDEFEQNAKSSAPYFDLEVWDNGVLHSGPKKYSEPFSYDDLYKAAILWEKISLVTTTGNTQGIVFLYDPFVAAGAAVAFPGQGSVNCPTGWMSNSLNYKSITTSGAWGNLHEYHHNFQGYGVGNGGEVTNNGMTLVSYALFTKISSARSMDSYGAAGLGGWNSYTSATWALEEVLKISAGGSPSNGKQGLALYATLLHNFGPDNYIQAKTHQSGGQNYVAYLKAWQNVTHNDMTYYFKDLLQGITAEEAAELSNPEYSMFVPISSVYQTGRSYMYDGEKKYFKTMQPYVINYGEEFEFDLNKYEVENGQYISGSINLPDGFSYKVKDVKQPQYGSVTPKGNNVYTYKPDKKEMNSGEIIVTLQITKDDDPSFKVDDVDLVIEFEQTHEKNKFTLERTTYTYDAANMYTDAEDAYNNNYAKYSSKNEGNNLNGTQNSNTDIWYYPNNDQYKDSPYVVPENSVAEVKGKLYFKDAGKYRLYLRGRSNCAMYYSVGNEDNYQLGAKIKTLFSNSASFQISNPDTYVDVEVEAETWVYFKTVLIVKTTPMISYIGLGFAQWTEPMFTIQEIKDADGNVIGTKYYDYMGREVSEEEANNAALIPPTKASYCTAYRSDYEFSTKEFEADYFYTRKYNYNYVGDTTVVTEGKKQNPTADCNYIAWSPIEQSIDNLFDGKSDTGIHFSSAWGVSSSRPAILAFDIGETVTANSMTLYTYLQTGSNSKGFP
ncbi:MAG: M60 family metallopeptidase, partial [Clostridia bacterium]|nr:M60 family metallopeptidase [Clostridia bacterium]